MGDTLQKSDPVDIGPVGASVLLYLQFAGSSQVAYDAMCLAFAKTALGGQGSYGREGEPVVIGKIGDGQEHYQGSSALAGAGPYP